MKYSQLKNKVKFRFDGGFAMPKICFSCGEPVGDKKWQITTTNLLKNRKFIFKFPVCDNCVDAHSSYINILPINIIGAVILLFSVFTLVMADTNIPAPLFYLGGLVWMVIVVWYLITMNKKARKIETEIDSQRAKDLKTAIHFDKISINNKDKKGEAIILFRNNRFSKEFTKLNKGTVID